MTTHAPWFASPTAGGIDTPVVVLGAGLAGCHTAYELASRNVKVLLLDAGDFVASGASGNSVGIVKPFVTRRPSNADQFYTAAFEYLLQRLSNDTSLRDESEFNACGVLQLIDKGYPDNSAYRLCTCEQASQIAGEQINSEALFFARGGYLNPQSLSAALLKHQNIDVQLGIAVSQINRADSEWLLATNDKTIKCKTLILANGENINQFAQTKELPITAARGQTSRFNLDNIKLRTVVTGKHYAIPQRNGLVVGATFTRDDKSRHVNDADHNQNRSGLDTLMPSLAVADAAATGFCGIRATTPDRLPIVGPVPDFKAYQKDYKLIKDGLPAHQFVTAKYQKNLFVIGGFGSRGIVSAPYCAKLLATQLCQTDSTLETCNTTKLNTLTHWATLLHPGRFMIRALKRNNPLVYSDTL